MPELLTAAPVRMPPALECPAWCGTGHGADLTGPGLWSRTHLRMPQSVNLQDRPDVYATVWVAVEDTWRPDASTGWRRDRPYVLAGSAYGAPIQIWNVPTLRPILKAGPLLIPGLLDLIVEAVQFCEIKMPQEYAR